MLPCRPHEFIVWRFVRLFWCLAKKISLYGTILRWYNMGMTDVSSVWLLNIIKGLTYIHKRCRILCRIFFLRNQFWIFMTIRFTSFKVSCFLQNQIWTSGIILRTIYYCGWRFATSSISNTLDSPGKRLIGLSIYEFISWTLLGNTTVFATFRWCGYTAVHNIAFHINIIAS